MGYSLERSDDVGGRPADDERRVAGARQLGHLVDGLVRRAEPHFADEHPVFQLEVPARPGLGHEQEVVEEEQVPVLALDALQIFKQSKANKRIVMMRF